MKSSDSVNAPISVFTEVAKGASVGASIGALAGSVIATGAALSLTVPFVAAALTGVAGACYGWSHKRG